VIFIASSIPKLFQPYDFLAGVYSYELVGAKLGVMVAIMLPWLELFVGICLVGGVFVRGAILASMGMCAMFSLALVSALWRGLEISCGCFSLADQNVISYLTVIRAVILLIVSAAIYIYAVFGEQKTHRS
jgi:putative oxidoreductase